MLKRIIDNRETDIYLGRLEYMVNPTHFLYRLALKIPWDELEKMFEKLYAQNGRSSIPVRTILGILILKQMFNLSDRKVIATWKRDVYFQFFCGETTFQTKVPCSPTTLVHFRKKIDTETLRKIFVIITKLHDGYKEDEVISDTTVQEKNITFPTDVKLYCKIISFCLNIAEKYNIKLRQTYVRVLKGLKQYLKFVNHPKNRKKAQKAINKIKTIAGRLYREIERKLSSELKIEFAEKFLIMERILTQEKNDKNKIYSFHASDVYCVAKGKENIKYEFGKKISIIIAKISGLILAIESIPQNDYDGHILPGTLALFKKNYGRMPKAVIVDRGYKGQKIIDGTVVISAKKLSAKASEYEKRQLKERMRRRSSIEAVISHLKNDYGMLKNYLQANAGDLFNCTFAAIVYNLKIIAKT